DGMPSKAVTTSVVPSRPTRTTACWYMADRYSPPPSGPSSRQRGASKNAHPSTRVEMSRPGIDRPLPPGPGDRLGEVAGQVAEEVVGEGALGEPPAVGAPDEPVVVVGAEDGLVGEVGQGLEDGDVAVGRRLLSGRVDGDHQIGGDVLGLRGAVVVPAQPLADHGPDGVGADGGHRGPGDPEGALGEGAAEGVEVAGVDGLGVPVHQSGNGGPVGSPVDASRPVGVGGHRGAIPNMRAARVQPSGPACQAWTTPFITTRSPAARATVPSSSSRSTVPARTVSKSTVSDRWASARAWGS